MVFDLPLLDPPFPFPFVRQEVADAGEVALDEDPPLEGETFPPSVRATMGRYPRVVLSS